MLFLAIGIGIALSVGMAVDCNIIIFERIREELRAERSVVNAINAGFDRAAVAVLDSNITTLLAGVVLYSYGTGPLRGFAVTLMIGIFTTVYTGVFVTRVLMELVNRGNRPHISI
jgi:protein-export membrane protein SecD